MKKTRKITAVFSAALMSLNLLSSLFTVSAFSSETAGGKSDSRYTLEELFAMSDDEFFALDGDLKYDLEEFKKDVRYVWEFGSDNKVYGGLSGKFIYGLKPEDVGVIYKANITESEIESLLGNTVKYSVSSPLLDLNIWDFTKDDYVYYGNIFLVSFPDYTIASSETEWASDEQIMELLKCRYCINQVMELHYYEYGAALGAAPGNEKVLTGDVNLDKKVNTADAKYMEMDLSGEITFTDAQKKIADVNGDGTFDKSDLDALNEQLNGGSSNVYTVPEGVEPTKYGDVNGDTKISIADAISLNLFLLNSEKYPLKGSQLANSDCFKDGIINTYDSSVILNYLSELVDISALGSK